MHPRPLRVPTVLLIVSTKQFGLTAEEAGIDPQTEVEDSTIRVGTDENGIRVVPRDPARTVVTYAETGEGTRFTVRLN